MIKKINGVSVGIQSEVYSTVVVSGTTTTIMDTIFIAANTFSGSYPDVVIVNFMAGIDTTIGAPTFTYRLYWNDTPSTLHGGIQLGTYTTVPNSLGVSLVRHLYITSSGVYVVDPTISFISEYSSTTNGTISLVTLIDFTSDGYLICTANKDASVSTSVTSSLNFNVNI